MKFAHVSTFRRKRDGKTNYKRRRSAVVSKLPLLNVFMSSKNVYAQVVRPKVAGDSVLASASSLQLTKMGWLASRKNLPACYLTGLLLGKKAVEAGLDDVIVYVGLGSYRSGSRISAVVKGAVDAGLKVRTDGEGFPDGQRVAGEHISGYARKVREVSQEALQARFSGLVRAGVDPEGLPAHFQSVRAKIMEGKP